MPYHDERKLMIEMSKCPQCGGAYDAGDRFCQDCGQNLVPPTGLHLQSNRKFGWITDRFAARQGQNADEADEFASLFGVDLRPIPANINNAPAELILIGAAVLYVVSAIAWSNHEQIISAFHKMSSVKVAVSWPLQFNKHKSIAGNGQAPNTVPPTMQATASKHGRHDMPPVQAKEAAEETARAKAAQSPAPRATQQASQLTQAATQQPAIQQPAQPIEPVVQQTAVKSHASKQEIDELTEYNKLLADYFTRQSPSAPQASEPPSFDEWKSGQKQPF